MTATLAKIKEKLKKPAKGKAPAEKKRASSLPVTPPGTPFSLPPAILTALRRVMAKQLRVNFLECFFFVLALLPGLWLLQALADWWFNLPWTVRLVLLLADAGLAAFFIYRYAVRPFRNRLTLESAALRVEKEIPSFRTSLISTVELASAKAGCSQGSLALVGELLNRVNLQVRTMDLARMVVKTQRLKRYAQYAVLVVAVVAAAVYLAWPKPPILLRRILLGTQPLPTRTIVIPVSKDFAVPIGSEVVLSARAEGVIPKTGRLLVVYADKTRQEITASSTVDAPDVFSVALQNIQQPFRYHFVLNDGTGPDFEVKAKIPPVLASFKCVQTYPAYTGIPPAEMSAGNLTLLSGSKVKIEGAATQPLRTAGIRLEGVSQSVDLKVDGKNIRGEFTVPKDGMTGFSIPLVSGEGVASVENTLYRIELVEDKAPAVELTVPSSARLGVLVKSKPRLIFSAKDDYGIRKLALKFEISRPAPPGGEEPPAEPGEILLPLPEDGGIISNMAYDWDLGALKPALTEGCTINYWVEAVDNNDVTGPGAGQSAKKSLAVLSEQAKRAELLEMMGASAGEIENVYNTQKKVNEELDTTIRKTQP